MKKRVLLLGLILILSMSLFGCFNFEEYSKVEIIESPKTQFVVGDSLEDLQIILKATKTDDTTLEVVITFAADGTVKSATAGGADVADKVSVTGFSTEKEGSFTATITFDGNVCSLDYRVSSAADTGFAGGDGTIANPYLIANARQFANIVLLGDMTKYTYYKLVADIDFSTVNFNELTTVIDGDTYTYNQLIDPGYALYPKVPMYSFVGSLDGSAGDTNFKLKNFTATYDNVSLFGNIANGSFSNIDVSGFNTVGYRAGAFASNAYFQANGEDYATVSFKNVNILENCKLSYGAYLAQAKMSNVASFENCTMSGTVFGDGDNVGGFVGATTSSKSVQFVNCVMNGKVVGYKYVGAYIGYEGSVALSFSGCSIGDSASVVGYADSSVAWIAHDISEDAGCTISSSARLEVMMNEALSEYELVQNGSNYELTLKEGATADSEIAYFRVKYLGAVNHFIKDADGVYRKYFSGGYMTPLWQSGKLTVGSTVPYYTRETTYAYAPGEITIVVNEKNDDMFFDRLTSDKSKADGCVVNGYREGDDSLLLYKGKNFGCYLFAYNAQGEIIGATSITIESVNPTNANDQTWPKP